MDYSPTAMDKQEPIAIVGAACRFAGEATSLDSLWDMLSKVKTGHCKVPSDRWDSDKWHHPDPDRKGGISPEHGYFIQQDISHFDAPFFSVTAKEAAAMDPMKRMLLEVCFETFENAGIPLEDLMNTNTGCYVGCMTNDYEMISLHDVYDISHPAATGLSEAMTANRVSWFFGLKGPSLTLDTACSSSLYALHLACQSLRLKETNMSLVTGVNLMINPNTSHQLTAMHMLSPEGISHTFDDRANGYGRGDGIGAVVVKRLSDALRDGDTIRAVIRGSSINADGKTPSITQPSSVAQAELITQTYEAAGLDLAETDYFECHGTGTPVGDPLELTAIATTLGAARREAGKPPLHIGSIKPTVGHTEGCAGLAGVFKSILLLEKGMLVPTYGIERVNPKLKLDEWHLTLPEEVASWPTSGTRRVSVNSFGFGGANAHVVLEDAYHYLQARGLTGKHKVSTLSESSSDSGVDDASEAESELALGKERGKKLLFLFSGRDQDGAKRVTGTLNSWLQPQLGDKTSSHTAEDLGFTLAMCRTHLEHRTFAVAESVSALTQKLSKPLPAATRPQRHGDNLVMVFTGQGAQWAKMSSELLSNSIFRQSIEASQSYLDDLGCQWDAVAELCKTTAESNINRPEYSQPLCTVVQVALADLLRYWGVTPVATIGHSSGEIAAAYAAFLVTHQDAVKLAYVRGISSAAVPKQGAMMAAGLSQDEAESYLSQVAPGSAVVACVNSPVSVTLSGDIEAIDHLETLIMQDSKFARKLKVTTAYHSPHMREVSPTYLEMIGEITPPQGDNEATNASRPVMYSSLTGAVVSSARELDAAYWVNNMQNPVRFSQGMQALLKHKKKGSGANARPVAVQWGGFLEVGPHAALQGPLRQIIDASKNKSAQAAPYASMLSRGKDASETALIAAGTLWAAGYSVDMSAVNQPCSVGVMPQMICELPAYPWNHGRSYWHESYASRSYRFPPHARSDLLGIPEDSQSSYEPRWRNYLRVTENPWIQDHVITGTVLYPGAGMLAMALEGVLRTAEPSVGRVEGFRLTNVLFERGLVISLDDTAPVETRISLYPLGMDSSGFSAPSWGFTVYSMTRGSTWVKHCSGTIALVYNQGESDVEDGAVDASWEENSATYKALLADEGSTAVNVEDFYSNLDSIGMQYGPTFRNVVSLLAVPDKTASHGTVAVPDTKSTMPSNYETPHIIHPATLDSVFHLVIASLDCGMPSQAAVPYHIDEIYIARDQPKEPGALYSGFGRLLSKNGHELNTELFVSDQLWSKPKLTIKNFALRQVTSGDGLPAPSKSQPAKKCADITWIPDLALSAAGGNKFEKLVPSAGSPAAIIDPWLDSVFLKSSDSTALVIMFHKTESSMGILDALKNCTHGPKKLAAYATSEVDLEWMKAALGQGSDGTTITYEWLPESELVQALVSREPGDLVIGLDVPDIPNNAPALASLASVACLTTQIAQGSSLSLPGAESVSRVANDGTYIVLASATTAPSQSYSPEFVVLVLPEEPSRIISELAAVLTTKLESLEVSVSQATLTASSLASLSTKHVISLLEADTQLVYAWDQEQFLAFKALVSSVQHMLWITHGSVLQSWSNGVEFAVIQGLFRVLRNEYPMAILPTLDFSASADISSGQNADLVLDVWRASFAEGAEMEYAEGDGLVWIPRATEDSSFDYELQLENHTATSTWSTLGSPGVPLKASDLGDTRGCVWIPDDEGGAPLEAGQVEVKVEYLALLGAAQTLECAHLAAGVVTRQAVNELANEHPFGIGQRVVVLSHGNPGTHIRQSHDLVVPLPNGIEPQAALAQAEPLITALYALSDTARLASGRTLLLDDAASPVGQALVHVAKSQGVDQIFALVHNRDERDLLASRLGLPLDRIFDAGRTNFVPLIQRATVDRGGIDCVISRQRGPHVEGAMSLLSDWGQFIDMHSGRGVLPPLKPNATLARIDMSTVFQSRQAVVGALLQQAFTTYMLKDAPKPAVRPVTNLLQALAPSNAQIKQAVLRFGDANPVLTNVPQSRDLRLDSEVVYVLAGGLGALGLNIADWMIKCGARNLAFLSRSGGSKNEKELRAFHERSVRAEAFKCSVSDASSVVSVFETIRATGRKIGGVVQLAMVLDDGIFDNMSFDQWRHAIEPKTSGSRNLLANLQPGEKPFFILLSSITGVIGNTAQANYAAGNTFEDALAHHARTHLGINATSINVGLVTDSAHFTSAGEYGDLAGYLSRYAHGWRGLQTTLDEVGVVMRAIMRGATTDRRSPPAQVVLGLGDNIPHELGARGYTADRKFELRVVRSIEQQALDGEVKQDVGALLAQAGSMAEAITAVEDSIKELVAKAMGISTAEVDSQSPLYNYGVDSLQAVEIRNRAQMKMQSDISVFDILSAMPLAEVAAKIAGKSQLVKVSTSEE